jgi:hypothetical protein
MTRTRMAPLCAGGDDIGAIAAVALLSLAEASTLRSCDQSSRLDNQKGRSR